jgi:hypothetical protein
MITPVAGAQSDRSGSRENLQARLGASGAARCKPIAAELAMIRAVERGRARWSHPTPKTSSLSKCS